MSRRTRETLEAARALAGAAQWCAYAAPIFGGPPGESTADWMDRLIEYNLAARGGGCHPDDHDWTPWGRARWRDDKARRDCLKCGYIQLRRLVGPFPHQAA